MANHFFRIPKISFVLLFGLLLVITTALSPKLAQAQNNKVAVILFNFQNNTNQPWTPSFVRNVTFTGANSVNAYYQENSSGELSLTGKLNNDGDVFGWYTIPYSNTNCNYRTWSEAAKLQAQNAGVDLNGYDSFIYAFPSVPACGFGGTADFTSSPGESWINGVYTGPVVGHEFGHTLGLGHASTYRCTDSNGTPVAFSNTCTKVEYGDSFDIMGNTPNISGTPQTPNHLHSFHKGQLQYLDNAQLQTVTEDGVYTLSPNEAPAGSIQSIRIPRDAYNGTATRYYYLEFRQPLGTFHNFSDSSPVANGVSIRLAGNYPEIGQNTLLNTFLLDTKPETSSFSDSALVAGQTFTDLITGISITTQSVSATGAVVEIEVGNTAQSDITPPTAPSNFEATAQDGSTVNLSWTPATDNIGVIGYQIYRDGALGIQSETASISDTTVIPGTTYSYVVKAYDEAGNYSVSSQTITITTPAPPAPHITLSAQTLEFNGIPGEEVGPAPQDITISNTGIGSMNWSAEGDQSWCHVSPNEGTLGSGTSEIFSVSVDSFGAEGIITCIVAITADGALNSPQILTVNYTLQYPGDTIPPTAPDNLTATVSFGTGTEVDLTWAVSEDNIGVTGYQIYRDGEFLDISTSNSYTDPGVVEGSTYSYQVQAYDAANNFSSPSNAASVDVVAPQAHIVLNPAVLAFTASLGGSAPASKTSQLFNSGNGNLVWSASTNQAWCSITPSAGTITPESPAFPLSVAVGTPTALGTTNCIITITGENSDNSPQMINISYVVSDTTAPTITLTAPVNNEQIRGTKIISANASDNVGVSRVEFYRNSATLIGTDTTSPYAINWDSTTVVDGNYSLSAKSYDNAGNVSPLSSVNTTVDNTPPVVNITSPGNNSALRSTVTISAAASDAIGVTKVELYRNGVLIDTKTAAPYNFLWNTTSVTDGSYQLLTKASDAANNVGTSAIITVTVDNIPPVTALTAPANNAPVSGTVTVSATATDASGVTKVEFYRDGSILIGTDTTSPYSITWDSSTATVGNHILTSKAYDAAANTTASAGRTVNVLDSIAPTTVITSPLPNAQVNKKSTVTIAATATDNVGVTKVEFYVNNVLKCTDTTSAYTCAWSVPNGVGITYQLQTKAYDARNNIGSSAIISVTSR